MKKLNIAIGLALAAMAFAATEEAEAGTKRFVCERTNPRLPDSSCSFGASMTKAASAPSKSRDGGKAGGGDDGGEDPGTGGEDPGTGGEDPGYDGGCGDGHGDKDHGHDGDHGHDKDHDHGGGHGHGR